MKKFLTKALLLYATSLAFACNNSRDVNTTTPTEIANTDSDTVVVKDTTKNTSAENREQTEPDTREAHTSNQIHVKQPLPDAAVTSPLNIKGEAKGTWFFEASFPVILYDANHKQLARGTAKADGNWMTEKFVPFNATLTFTAPGSGRGTLVFEKANPSGMKENADSVVIPVIFPPKK
jgi:hypothetical protein